MARINRNREVSKLTLALASIGAFAGLFELGAVATNAYPTISELLWATPVAARVVIIVAAVVASVDHFITRRWL